MKFTLRRGFSIFLVHPDNDLKDDKYPIFNQRWIDSFFLKKSIS